MDLLPIREFLQKPMPTTIWLIDGWLPMGGIVMLHGGKSLGKSPLTWAIAQSVSEGVPFFGYPTLTTGPILYIELDTPEVLVQPRLKLLNPIPDRMWLLNMSPGIDLVHPLPSESRRLVEADQTVQPVLVVVNTLRKAHRGDDKLSETPSDVYQALHRFFPTATKLVVHHDRKGFRGAPGEISGDDPDQMFSGSAHWSDDSQVVLHLVPTNKKERRVRLEMTGSQCSAITRPISLQLGEDGTSWVDQGPLEVQRVWATLDPGLPKMQRYELVAARLGVDSRTVQRALKNGQT